jgi:Xaa-Pro aminopeptidase
MEEAFVVGVTTEVGVMDDRARALWAVVTDTPEQAVRAVRDRVSPGSEVDGVVGKLSSETTKKLGLPPGQARHL